MAKVHYNVFFRTDVITVLVGSMDATEKQVEAKLKDLYPACDFAIGYGGIEINVPPHWKQITTHEEALEAMKEAKARLDRLRDIAYDELMEAHESYPE